MNNGSSKAGSKNIYRFLLPLKHHPVHLCNSTPSQSQIWLILISHSILSSTWINYDVYFLYNPAGFYHARSRMTQSRAQLFQAISCWACAVPLLTNTSTRTHTHLFELVFFIVFREWQTQFRAGQRILVVFRVLVDVCVRYFFLKEWQSEWRTGEKGYSRRGRWCVWGLLPTTAHCSGLSAVNCQR